ncbi:uncharacterized protein PHACADRAFT_194585 [Phanerochaete carnosa HHB-10118-sp]|uniref:Uncharacterized protein n=1 Tax=Phanerochaete carnosa (strain HHB-10118-sp) TaxID=650164 RepID=K5WCM7_PHACS|nr:uncharacterized protein PHACADRAFT_194585 [Phanerochaete carnosa HHB-10118-sp]EKM57010.1 hypothetical protein PHACADRAFT_194585 [Phanerochaete carnosa HHB-10118-sp]
MTVSVSSLFPVGWQILTNDVLTGTLDKDNFQEYLSKLAWLAARAASLMCATTLAGKESPDI